MASHDPNVVYAVPLADYEKDGDAHDMHCGACTCHCKDVQWRRVSVASAKVTALAGVIYARVMQRHRLDKLGAKVAERCGAPRPNVTDRATTADASTSIQLDEHKRSSDANTKELRSNITTNTASIDQNRKAIDANVTP
jgi:hypothetical protein